MSWNERYRPLKEGEVIRAGDECLTDAHLGWNDAHADTVGQPAPSSAYSSHRMYRRLLTVADFAAPQEAKQ